MKVLQVNNVYAQKSTGKLTKALHDGLKEVGVSSLVVYGRGKTFREDGVIRLCPEWYGKAQSLLSRVTGMPYGGCWLSTLRLMGIIRREKPDVVHLQCINGNFVNIYWLIWWLKKHCIRTVVGLHAEFMYTGSCGHAFECMQWQHGCRKCPNLRKATRSILFDRTAQSWRRMKAAFDGFEENSIVAPVSPWTRERALQSDILKTFRFQTVFNGVDTERGFFYDPGVEKADKLVLNVTAQFSPDPAHAKGGWYLIQLARRMPHVTFLVAGRAQPAEDLPENLVLLGEVRDQEELANLYRKAKLSILVSRRETFSMPCAESMCCGTPVVGFRAGAPEQISIPAYSEFVEFGDVDTLEAVVRRWLDREDLCPEETACRAEQTYSAQTMVRDFIELYGRI